MGASESTHVDAEAPYKPEKRELMVNYEDAKEPFIFVDPRSRKEILTAAEGPASAAQCKPTTIGALFLEAAKRQPNRVALGVERPLPAFDEKAKRAPPSVPRDQWKTWTWQQYYDETRVAAKGMIKLGLQRHEAVNIFGFNSPEWIMAEMAAILAGAKAAGIYPTDTTEQVAYKSNHSGASIAVIEDPSKFKKFSGCINQLPRLKAIVTWGFEAKEELKRTDGSVVRTLTWEGLLKEGAEVEDSELQARLDDQRPGDCAALIYTSGTTGNPKAVMMTHDNLLFSASSVLSVLDFLAVKPEAERIISYLPLSHVAGMMVDVLAPIVGTALRAGWVEVYCARPYDLKNGTLGERLKCIKPTIFLGVPRVWEKIAEKLQAVGAKTKGFKKWVATWAKEKSLAHQKNCQLGGTGGAPLHGMAKNILVKVKQALGLDECKFGFTGAAPIEKETLEYFGSVGIQINELYGMSECGGSTTISTDSAHIWGSCGWALPGTEVRVFQVDPADLNKKVECPKANDIFHCSEQEQGEICYRGRHIMLGYMANPDLGEEHVADIQKKTKEAIDADGWLHSGDKGVMGSNGMLRITGRYKELIIGSGGENVAPVPIENNIKRLCPAVSNVMMVGDKRKFNIALITLKTVGATGTEPGSNELLAQARAITSDQNQVKTVEQACKDPAVAKAIEAAIVETNKTAANQASFIQRFTILHRDFSVNTDELTPTLKLKRTVAERKHTPMIDRIYDAPDGTYIPYADDLAQHAFKESAEEKEE